MAHKDSDILGDIRDLGDLVDGTPTLQQYREQGSYSASLLYDRFGSWRSALEAAGFDPREPQQKIPKADLREELERLDAEIKGPPTVSMMNERGKYSASTYKERFGSWNDALEAMGLSPAHTTTPEYVTKRELIADIQRVADLCDATPTHQDMMQEGDYGVTTCQEKFGSWTDAVEAAGFEPKRTRGLSKDQLIQELHRLQDELGRRPNSSDMAEQGKHGIATYQRHFGSWSKAVEVAFNNGDE